MLVGDAHETGYFDLAFLAKLASDEVSFSRFVATMPRPPGSRNLPEFGLSSIRALIWGAVADQASIARAHPAHRTADDEARRAHPALESDYRSWSSSP